MKNITSFIFEAKDYGKVALFKSKKGETVIVHLMPRWREPEGEILEGPYELTRKGYQYYSSKYLRFSYEQIGWYRDKTSGINSSEEAWKYLTNLKNYCIKNKKISK